MLWPDKRYKSDAYDANRSSRPRIAQEAIGQPEPGGHKNHHNSHHERRATALI